MKIKAKRQKSAKGFTIIEVVLVLAIAGLIFLMVFIALPMLQRAQRNTQREDDLSRFLSAVVDYQSNNGGRTPFQNVNDMTITRFVTRYIDESCDVDESYLYNRPVGDACFADQFRDPDGTPYSFNFVGTFSNLNANSSLAATLRYNEYSNVAHTVFVISGAVCGSSEGTAVRASGERYVAMYMVLEGGGITCVTNGARGNDSTAGNRTIYFDPYPT